MRTEVHRSSNDVDRQPPPTCRRSEAEAPRDCPLCPRLVAFREECRVEHPDWWNAPVPAFGDPRCVAGDRRPGAGQARRQPHRAAFHRRFRRGIALRDAVKFGLARRRLSRPIRRWPAAERRDHPQRRQMPAARQQARAAGDRDLPPVSRVALGALPNVRVVIALGQIAHVAAARSLGLRRRRPNSATAPSMSRRTAECCCRATIARATTRTPAARRGNVRERVRAGASASPCLRKSAPSVWFFGAQCWRTRLADAPRS